MRYLNILILSAAVWVSGCVSGPANNAVAVPSVSASPATSEPAAGQTAASPAVTPQHSPTAGHETELDPAAAVIREYYTAINARDFRRAYELWDHDGAASKQTFEQFSGGFADTLETNVEIGKPGDSEGAAGSQYITVPVEVRAKLKNGGEQHFKGEYVLRRSMVEGAEHRGEWRIYSAEIRKL